MEKNNTLIILGMHRSGTSYLSQQIIANGLDLGNQLLGKGVGNENGHFEDLDFHDFHEQVFKQNNISYGGLKLLNKIELSEYHYRKAQYLVSFKNSISTQWGWKDPRTCLFIDLWDSVIDEKKYLVLFRPYEEVVNSLISRDLKTVFTKRSLLKRIRYPTFKIKNDYKNIYLKSWIIYNQHILSFLEQKDQSEYFVTSFNNAQQNISTIIKHLGVKWGFNIINSTQKYTSNYNKSLLSKKQPYSFDNELENEAKEIYSKLLNLQEFYT